jgi:hypothetical protein
MNSNFSRILIGLSACSLALFMTIRADAFCGFYVSGASDDLVNNASNVVLMREGRRTVLSMQNNYEGPAEDFALVVPVPQVLEEENVRTLDEEVFERVNAMAAPRLVEYWERDPCAPPRPPYEVRTRTAAVAQGDRDNEEGSGGEVRIEAQFEVGEYEIVILSSDDSVALGSWLEANEYQIPENAEQLLRPYIESEMYFFAAKVDVEKVEFDESGQARLSPLRFHYDSDDFQLPIRLGFINAEESQDLVVHILARNQRYDVANYPNATIPTNLFVVDSVKDSFAGFYRQLFDETVNRHEGAVITEYAWNAATCDPCPGATLTTADFATLGADVLDGEDGSGSRRRQIQSVSFLDTSVRGDGELSSGELAVALGFVDEGAVKQCLAAAESRKDSEHFGSAVRIGFELTTGGDTRHLRAEPEIDDETGECLAAVFSDLDMPVPEGGSSVVMTDWRVTRADRRPPSIRPGMMSNFVLTRLHAKLDPDQFSEDLIFRKAAPISGGRGGATNLDKGAVISQTNQFQGRYIIRHPWEGEVDCDEPTYGQWGGPPSDSGSEAPVRTTSSWESGRTTQPLSELVTEDIAQLDIETTVPHEERGGGDSHSDERSSEEDGSSESTSQRLDTDNEQAGPNAEGEAAAEQLEGDTTPEGERSQSPEEKQHIPWSDQPRSDCSSVNPSNTTGIAWLFFALALYVSRRRPRQT